MACFYEEGYELVIPERGDSRVLRSDRSGAKYVTIDDMAFYVRSRDATGIRTFPGNKWPKGVVAYQFANGLSTPKKDAFKQAAKLWSDVAKVSFAEKADPQGYVFVEDGTEDEFAVGFEKLPGQLFQIVTWSNVFVIAHEIGHTLGMAHEHVRSDRDTFVEIHDANIKPGHKYEENFHPKIKSKNYSDYDYESIMHYPYNAFGIEVLGVPSRTISVRAPNTFDEKLLGKLTKLSSKDKSDMADHYK